MESAFGVEHGEIAKSEAWGGAAIKGAAKAKRAIASRDGMLRIPGEPKLLRGSKRHTAVKMPNRNAKPPRTMR